ncbi:hypothetical protein PR001_g18454 [Phytophthora rubi]|uniref:Uncharacterized protein n=1 Tax=Phytophthora rubi TaxID=129364 RepID=A0A6A3K3E4_9STRA|nr:hypothetical protein PR001_g18454 [Phytophthora rubi]
MVGMEELEKRLPAAVRNQTVWPSPPREPPRPFGWTPSTGWRTVPAASAPAKTVIKKEKTKKQSATKAMTIATTTTTAKPSTVPAPPKQKKKTAKSSGVPATTMSGMKTGVNAWNAAPFPAQPTAIVPANLISVSQATSHAVKVLPFFYSDLTSAERARTFWEAFEPCTRGKLLSKFVTRRRSSTGSGRERWWLLCP